MTIGRFQGQHAFLSNFWPCPVMYEFDGYPSVEHAYQAAKFPASNRRSFQSGSPGNAKRMGRRPGRREDWQQVKYGIMLDLVEQKFRVGTTLAARLMATGAQELEEGNTWGDVYWGKNLLTGEGENHLGKILMHVRQNLWLQHA